MHCVHEQAPLRRRTCRRRPWPHPRRKQSTPPFRQRSSVPSQETRSVATPISARQPPSVVDSARISKALGVVLRAEPRTRALLARARRPRALRTSHPSRERLICFLATCQRSSGGAHGRVNEPIAHPIFFPVTAGAHLGRAVLIHAILLAQTI